MEVGDFDTDEDVAKVRSLSRCRSDYARSVWLCTYVLSVCMYSMYVNMYIGMYVWMYIYI